ncbi:type II toxin-antitoxin system HicA family toxin (plasmid) [Salinigranum rubrum]|uniref:Type II toxin-antitoxin system HicA family toxin n=1 Tax=Salinigranum rubrum TaxID=755307 RepID=A0A2I8VS02_9EURY|nr:type II toxin-antitoxin system HicA family toxin [Salinigranum rubrum]AUV84687.1 type II toxin-antitoxin system HicA family toxin [Salinigranum rubrum]
MVTRDFSGEDIYKVLVNVGNFSHVRTTGDHVILKWVPPEIHGSETRTVVVPLHDSVSIGTLRDIATDAGAQDFEEFCGWIDRNR